VFLGHSPKKCSEAVKVYPIGETFAIFFVGEQLNEGVAMKTYSDGLGGSSQSSFKISKMTLLQIAIYRYQYSLVVKMGNQT